MNEGQELRFQILKEDYVAGPVAIGWPDSRDLAIVIQNSSFTGTLTRQAWNAAITMTYEPASSTPAPMGH